jgi:MFS family permease
MPARAPYYRGQVLLVAADAMLGTLRGRTHGLGLITEPLLADLQIGRLDYAKLNFWATLIGAAGAIGVGRFIDIFGSRVILTTLAVALGTIVCVMSRVTSFEQLAVTVTLTRALGQSALSVVSIAMVGQWFGRRIELAMAVYSVVMSIGFMTAFPVVGSIVQSSGWRQAWFSVGASLLVVLAPLAWLVVRRSPESIGLTSEAAAVSGYDVRAALATPAFWVFALGAALYGLVASGIGLFNESILLERGFGPDIYYQTLVVTAMTALAGNFLGGWLARFTSLNRLMAVSLFVLTAGLLALPHLDSLPLVFAWATAMGIGGGFVMVLFFSVWPRVYGRRHLGRIQGAAQALTVLASAVGPVLLAACVEWTGSYRAMFYILGAIVGTCGIGALLVSQPAPLPTAD